MDPTNAGTPIVIVSSAPAIQSMSASSSAPVFFLDSQSHQLLVRNGGDTPDILQQALDAAMPPPAAVTAIDSKVTKAPGFVTVFNSGDGTLTLSNDNVEALGLDASNLVVEKPKANNVVLIPSANHVVTNANNVAYILRQQPAVNVIRPTVHHVAAGRPTCVTNGFVSTNVLRPVMATGIVKSPFDKTQQTILPKPLPVVSVAPTEKNPPPVAFAVTSSMPAHVNNPSDPAQSGTSRFPIQLVQQGDMFQTLQPLNNKQVTEIARMLRQPRGNSPAVKDPKIVYEDKANKRKLIYKIMCKGDVVSASDDGSDPEDGMAADGGSKPSSNTIVLSAEELLAMTSPGSALRRFASQGKRKRGRPTGFERFFMLAKRETHNAKRLKAQFGLSDAQAQALEKDVVDDEGLVEIEVVDADEEIDCDGGAGKALGVSRTRSGRVSRPPAREAEAKASPKPAQAGLPLASLDTVCGEASKRKFTVPAKFRCRVCKKMYLGERKMSRHLKAHPTHAFSNEGSSRAAARAPKAAASSEKKMPDSLSVPIIPLARTQLAELVKNLDAELVLDCVGKKMFDNFSLWDLQLKKMELSKEKGLRRLEVLCSDMEDALAKAKRLVDNCLTHTQLCDKPAASLTLGEHMQLALNAHDGPLYLEQANHVPEEFYRCLGIDPVVPRSESNTLVTNPEEDEDENSNSLMSAASDKDASGHGGGLGAQMVLEQNLSAVIHARDEEDEEEEEDTLDGDKKAPAAAAAEVEPSKLEMLPPSEGSDKAAGEFQRTRLPSFSTIIAGSPAAQQGGDEPPPVIGEQPPRPSLVDIAGRRCSLDNEPSPMFDNHAHEIARRASVDGGIRYQSHEEDVFAVSTKAEAVISSLAGEATAFAEQQRPPAASAEKATDVQSLPPSGPPSVAKDPRQNASMPCSPMHSVAAIGAPVATVEDDDDNNFDNNTKSSHGASNLFNDIESVLDNVNAFHFVGPTTPEKLMASIPPSSMMVDKAAVAHGDDAPVIGARARTDFLGALAKDPKVDDRFVDGQESGMIIRSTLTDVVGHHHHHHHHHHHQHHDPVGMAYGTSEAGSAQDTLSQLFDEITSAKDVVISREPEDVDKS